ncbi:MAG TPA: tRNA (adenosine(37)-N6)-threonylcarbamoyltransferase complex transferase subunit TsaD [Candidatus Paceibacterota bacterium]|nr:tRNA (adenosine(37)-N6)-threonylcarbamoyltransferase complex transferase subunit TsaD [Candidatus Paceibacterota bacterium]
MIILGIETSCDETAISLLESDRKGNYKILSNVVSSQIKVHAPFGGVVPSLAKREHQKNLIPVLKTALKEAKLLRAQNAKGKTQNKISKIKTLEVILCRDEILLRKLLPFLKEYQKPSIDLISVTFGPGLAPALWPGVNLARSLSFYWNIPILPINHLEAHIIANWLTPVGENSKLKAQNAKGLFPAVALIISGGHTQLILMKKIGQYKLIGETRDDAVGECFDKTARLLGLPYPGGPAIAAEATKFQAQPRRQRVGVKIHLPRPMVGSQDFDFSFSGLKTAVLYLVNDLKKKKISVKKLTPQICYEFQETVNDVLVSKTIKAAKKHKAQSIILGGGVAANQSLINRFSQTIKKELPKIQFIYPERKFSTDNAAMIALTAYFNLKNKKKKVSWKSLEADANLRL